LREFSRKGHSIDLFACPLEMEARSLTDDEVEEKDEMDEDEQETRKPVSIRPSPHTNAEFYFFMTFL